jgi:ribonucleoside-diphosphate reductase subunit M1
LGKRFKNRYFIIINSGMYYLRTRPAVDPIKFTVDVEALLKEGG